MQVPVANLQWDINYLPKNNVRNFDIITILIFVFSMPKGKLQEEGKIYWIELHTVPSSATIISGSTLQWLFPISKFEEMVLRYNRIFWGAQQVFGLGQKIGETLDVVYGVQRRLLRGFKCFLRRNSCVLFKKSRIYWPTFKTSWSWSLNECNFPFYLVSNSLFYLPRLYSVWLHHYTLKIVIRLFKKRENYFSIITKKSIENLNQSQRRRKWIKSAWIIFQKSSLK